MFLSQTENCVLMKFGCYFIDVRWIGLVRKFWKFSTYVHAPKKWPNLTIWYFLELIFFCSLPGTFFEYSWKMYTFHTKKSLPFSWTSPTRYLREMPCGIKNSEKQIQNRRFCIWRKSAGPKRWKWKENRYQERTKRRHRRAISSIGSSLIIATWTCARS